MAAYTPATELARLVRDTLGPLPLVTSDVVHRDRERAQMAAADTRDYERACDAADRLDDNYRRLLQDFDDEADIHLNVVQIQDARIRQLTDENRNLRIGMDQLRNAFERPNEVRERTRMELEDMHSRGV